MGEQHCSCWCWPRWTGWSCCWLPRQQHPWLETFPHVTQLSVTIEVDLKTQLVAKRLLVSFMTISMLNVEYSKRRCSSLWHRVSACQSGCNVEWILVCSLFIVCIIVPSVLWRCWLGGRKGIRPVKNWVVGCWHSYLSGARCRLAYGPADATATPVLTHSCVSKVQIGFTFLVPAQMGSPGKRAVKRVYVCV